MCTAPSASYIVAQPEPTSPPPVQMLLYTAHQQKMCKRLEDALSGNYRPLVGDPSQARVGAAPLCHRASGLLALEAKPLESLLGSCSTFLFSGALPTV